MMPRFKEGTGSVGIRGLWGGARPGRAGGAVALDAGAGLRGRRRRLEHYYDLHHFDHAPYDLQHRRGLHAAHRQHRDHDPDLWTRDDPDRR
ncbi:MAG: hypothetical protein RLZZ200_1615 [Pseudomonadota bacterium]